MAQYTITYSCGHRDTVELFGKESQREWTLEQRKKGLCDACFHAKREAENEAARQAALAEAAEQDLPALEGSDKQVGWAVTIRAAYLAALDAWLAANPVREGADATPLLDAVQAIQTERSARWWIENGRHTDSFNLRGALAQRMTEAKKAEERAALDEPAPSATADAPILRPEATTTEFPAKIAIIGCTITITSPEKRDDFRQIVKDHGYRWDSTIFRWTRDVPAYRGPVTDRAAEIASLILGIGIPVQVFNETARAKTISGEFERDPTRWISKKVGGEYNGWFMVTFPFGLPDLYDAARKIAGSKYDRPNVVVPPVQFEAVLDYADEFGFALSPGARGIVEAAQAARAAQLIVKPKAAKKATKVEPGEGDAPLPDEN